MPVASLGKSPRNIQTYATHPFSLVPFGLDAWPCVFSPRGVFLSSHILRLASLNPCYGVMGEGRIRATRVWRA